MKRGEGRPELLYSSVMTRAGFRQTIGFATCSQYPDLTSDDRILGAALEKRGMKVVPVLWTETEPEAVSCDLLMVRSVWDYHLRPQDSCTGLTP